MAETGQFDGARYYRFTGAFRFANNRKLSAVDVCRWEALLVQSPGVQTLLPPRPNLWTLTPDAASIAVDHKSSSSLSDWSLVLEWARYITQQVLPAFGLSLEGQVGYQGLEAMDTGRLYIDANGEVAKQTTKKIPGVIGAVTCNNVALLQQLSQEQLQEIDCLGRSAAMLAALYCSWEALNFLLQSPLVVDWSQKETHTGISTMHFIAQNPHNDQTSEEYNRVISLLPAALPMSVMNASDREDFAPLDVAIMFRNQVMFRWLLSHGADPDGEYKQQLARDCLHLARPLPLANALSGLHATYTRSLLEAGATLFRANHRLCTDTAEGPAQPHRFAVRCSDHLPVLVEYGAFLFALQLEGNGRNVLATVNDPTCRNEFQDIGAAVNRGLAPRRHLVVMILAGRSQPHLTKDVVQLICRHADLLPYNYPSHH